MLIHAIVHFLIYTQKDHMSAKSVIKRYFDSLKNDRNNLQ